jgi:hypothetical protein
MYRCTAGRRASDPRDLYVSHLELSSTVGEPAPSAPHDFIRDRDRCAGAFRLMRRLAIVATILTVAAGCDKLKAAAGGSASATPAPVADALDLSQNPDILFQVFGERGDTRIIPLAALINGAIKPINLAPEAWRQFAAKYEKSGTTYTLYDNGRDVGTATVKQGMWENAAAPLYKLPNCESLLPLATVHLNTRVDLGYTVDLLASSASVTPPPPGPALAAAELNRLAHELGYRVGEGEGMSRKAVDNLEFRSFAVFTGATAAPTVIASFVDAGSEGADEAQSRHIFVIGDSKDGAPYAPTFSHAFAAATDDDEYRIYLNHLDLTGDGVQEIVVEARQVGGGAAVAVLGYQNGSWVEVFRSRSGWCLDRN